MGNQNKFCLFFCCCVKHIEKVNYNRARISDHGTICVCKEGHLLIIYWSLEEKFCTCKKLQDLTVRFLGSTIWSSFYYFYGFIDHMHCIDGMGNLFGSQHSTSLWYHKCWSLNVFFVGREAKAWGCLWRKWKLSCTSAVFWSFAQWS